MEPEVGGRAMITQATSGTPRLARMGAFTSLIMNYAAIHAFPSSQHFDPLGDLQRAYVSREPSRSHVVSVTPRSRSLSFCTLPLSVVGSLLTNSRYRGIAK